jgi:hypothetical protein
MFHNYEYRRHAVETSDINNILNKQSKHIPNCTLSQHGCAPNKQVWRTGKKGICMVYTDRWILTLRDWAQKLARINLDYMKRICIRVCNIHVNERRFYWNSTNSLEEELRRGTIRYSTSKQTTSVYSDTHAWSITLNILLYLLQNIPALPMRK